MNFSPPTASAMNTGTTATRLSRQLAAMATSRITATGTVSASQFDPSVKASSASVRLSASSSSTARSASTTALSSATRVSTRPVAVSPPSRATNATASCAQAAMAGRSRSPIVGFVGRDVPRSGTGQTGGVVRRGVRVEGIVQGVGFRPFVHALAARLELSGLVGNDATGVFIEVEGDDAAVRRFITALTEDPPRLAVVERVSVWPLPPTGETGFRIVASTDGGPRHALVSPDTATCADCLAEIFDPSDRRYRYAFTNCTNCGPRFSIVRDVPYDRPNTTMAEFAMCPECEREYHDPADRRFHAQPTCCPACGPHLRLVTPAPLVVDDAIVDTARLLDSGAVVAVKGIGGYHLAALASRPEAVDALRARKHREDKPFAIMVPDLAWARRIGSIGPAEEAALTSPARPIVLVERRPGVGYDVAAGVAPGNRSLGIMLPYAPLHHLLVAEVGAPFVLTSGNVSDEPIAHLDEDAFDRLRDIADAFLVHDRPIHVRVDDSVVRAVAGRTLMLRRSRGFAPSPVAVPWDLGRHVLACGAELKHTFAVAKDRRVFVSQHIGDLENYETYRAFVDGVDHHLRLFDVAPSVVAHDLHPEYLSTKYAIDLASARDDLELVGVQHHHAHVASCLADNGVQGPVIGVAFDGLGYGIDGTMWGGEFLAASITAFERVGWFEPVPMPGGAAAIRQPWRMAATYLDAVFGHEVPSGLAVVGRHAERWRDVVALARAGAGGAGGAASPLTSSAGRLFDAVAAIVSVRDTINYEGQAAIELEQLADPSVLDRYDVDVPASGPYVIAGRSIVAAVVADLLAGVPPPAVAARFHRTLVDAIGLVCDRVRRDTGLDLVALSGGVFQNALLTSWTVADLTARGFGALTHSRVPPNDGGISLGQAVVAGAVTR
jgi:hydrogenase maturation protein HypF